MTSCTAGVYDFKTKPELKDSKGAEIDNQTSKKLVCGTGKLEFEYAVKPDDEFGNLEITNNGSCDLEVKLEREYPQGRTTTRVKIKPEKFKVGHGNSPVSVIHSFIIPEPKKGGIVRVKISCQDSDGEKGCLFYYHFSAAVKKKKKKDVKNPNVMLNKSLNIKPPGIPGKNLCFTDPKRVPIVKTFTNNTKTDLYIHYKVYSDCVCTNFIVEAESYTIGKPRKRKTISRVSVPGNNVSRKHMYGAFKLKKGKTVELKARCFKGSLVTETCRGRIEDYLLNTSKKKPKGY